MERVSRRNRREGFLADSMTMYSLDYIFRDSFSQSFLHKIILGEFNVDLDYIYDRCEENRLPFEETMVKISKALFQNANPFIKNKIFYKFLHNYGLEIDLLISKLFLNLERVIDIDGLILSNPDTDPESYNRITETTQSRVSEILNRYVNSIAEFEARDDNFWVLRIIDDFYFNNKDSFISLLPYVTDTFNNVIKNCYRIEFDRSSKHLDGFLNIPSFGNTNTLSSMNNTLDFNTTNSSSNINTENFCELNLEQKVIKKEKITKNTPGIKVLNKSLKVIRKFIPSKELLSFLKCEEVMFSGEKFNWGFKLRERNDLIKYSEKINSLAINWDLYVYIKETDTKICRCCITFSGSPILDQVLSVYMMLRSGNEQKILNSSGFFEKNNTLFIEKIDPLLKKENSFQFGDNRFQNSMSLAFLRKTRIEANCKLQIKQWLKDYFCSLGFDMEIWEYVMNLDVSFEEAVDYEAFKLFDIKVFDKWVKPLVWKKDYFRFKNLVLNQNKKINQNYKEMITKI